MHYKNTINMNNVRIVRVDRPPRRPGLQTRNLKNRITCAYSPEERAAIEWLSRTPERDELRGLLKSLRGKPRRTIAKVLSASGLAKLVDLHSQIASPGRELSAAAIDPPPRISR